MDIYIYLKLNKFTHFKFPLNSISIFFKMDS